MWPGQRAEPVSDRSAVPSRRRFARWRRCRRRRVGRGRGRRVGRGRARARARAHGRGRLDGRAGRGRRRWSSGGCRRRACRWGRGQDRRRTWWCLDRGERRRRADRRRACARRLGRRGGSGRGRRLSRRRRRDRGVVGGPGRSGGRKDLTRRASRQHRHGQHGHRHRADREDTRDPALHGQCRSRTRLGPPSDRVEGRDGPDRSGARERVCLEWRVRDDESGRVRRGRRTGNPDAMGDVGDLVVAGGHKRRRLAAGRGIRLPSEHAPEHPHPDRLVDDRRQLDLPGLVPGQEASSDRDERDRSEDDDDDFRHGSTAMLAPAFLASHPADPIRTAPDSTARREAVRPCPGRQAFVEASGWDLAAASRFGPPRSRRVSPNRISPMRTKTPMKA
jgi:hypothetical protein